jgi:cytochrome P450
LKDFVDGESADSIVDLQDENQHRAIKRAIGSAFIPKNVIQYEADVDLILDGLVKKLHQEQIINLYETLQAFQVDFLFKMAFSEIPGHLIYGDVMGLGRREQERMSHWFRWQPMPILERFIFRTSFWGKWFWTSSRWAQIGTEKLRLRQASNTYGRNSIYNDLLHKYIRASKKFPDAIPPDAIANLLSTTILAGVDSTAGAMATVIYFLLKHPSKCQRLVEELEQADLSLPPMYAEASELRYLDAVIKEALRLNPPISVPLERVVPEPGFIVAGTHLPAGAIVGCTALVVHHDRACYGGDVEQFRPERWLECDEEQHKAMEGALLSWGSGKRICLGKHIAELEMKKTIPAILLTFQVSL